jgi:redox-sensitive bicupin YhaK (pirin superfamily)
MKVMDLKKVSKILPAQTIDMDGFPVKQALPTQNVPNLDPYLLLHHAKTELMFDRPARIQGIGPHPHRGFSPVTFVIEGEVHHRDSRGNSQVAKAGEVQWMHAGAGIIHSERPSENCIEKKMNQEIVQLWINSPAASKMKEPEYIHVNEPDFPRIVMEDGLSDLKLISGNYKGVKGKIKGQSDLLIVWGASKAGAKVILDTPLGFNSSLYIIRGDVRIEGHGIVDPESLVLFETEGTTASLEVKSDAQFLFLTGKPIDEKIVQQGPFVMNTETQILEAMRDYQMGKMGFLVEEDL